MEFCYFSRFYGFFFFLLFSVFFGIVWGIKYFLIKNDFKKNEKLLNFLVLLE